MHQPSCLLVLLSCMDISVVVIPKMFSSVCSVVSRVK